MRTPAEFFRKHQKVMLPVITGLAIIAFLVQDAGGGNGQNMSPMLVVFTLAVLCGGAAWVAGTAKEKGSEYGLVGVIVGVMLAFVINMYRKEGPSLSLEEQQRANKEIYVASQVAARMGRGAIDNPNVRHALLEEAHVRGIHLSDDVGGWQMKNAGMTRQDYDALKKNLQVTDALITSALRNEAEAGLVARGLYGDGMVLSSPVDWWDAYKKLNVRESALVAALPVDQFLDPKAEPKEADLVSLFEEYKRNVPNVTREGRREEGRPGFFQPPRVKVPYLVASIEAFEKLVPVPTAEEIEARYKESYPQPLPTKTDGGAGPLMLPELPGVPKAPEAPKIDGADAPKGEAPKTEAKPEAGKPADEAKPAAPAQPEAKPADEPKAPEAKPAEEKPAGEKGAEEKPAEAPKSSAIRREDGTVEVALVDDEKKDDAAPAKPEVPAAETPKEPAADAKPGAEKPAADAPAKEADPKAPADAAKEDETPPPPALPSKGLTDDPAPPSAKVRPLDDELKETLKEQIIRERAEKLAKERSEQAAAMIQTVLDRSGAPKVAPKPGVKAPADPAPPVVPEAPDHLTPEKAKAEIEKIAKDLNLELVEGVLIAPADVQESKDHPFKNARVPGTNWRAAGDVLQALFTQGSPLNTVIRGSNAQAGTELVLWKVEEIAPHEPKSLADIKDQVVAAWRAQQARKVVEKRAEELIKKAKESGKPLGEALQNETVTGQKDTLLLQVTPTGSFAWMTYFNFGPQFQIPPRISTVVGVEKAGESFMKTAFQDLKPGETGVAANADKTVYYVVQVEKRDDATPEEVAKLQERFIQDTQQGNAARTMAQEMSAIYQGNPYANILPAPSAELVDE